MIDTSDNRMIDLTACFCWLPPSLALSRTNHDSMQDHQVLKGMPGILTKLFVNEFIGGGYNSLEKTLVTEMTFSTTFVAGGFLCWAPVSFLAL